jgi:hypothetical protein
MMIRPYFGEAAIVGVSENELKGLTVFPNPNRGEFYIDGTFESVAILSSTGQTMAFSQTRDDEKTKISFRPAPGLYLVRVTTKNGSVLTEKIIVR